MASDPARLLEAELPEEARAALVALLLDSLDSNVDSDAEAELVDLFCVGFHT